MTLTVGSLFSGIGGLDLGLERAGMRVIWQVENDEFCNKVLAKHWPEVKRYGDIREIDWSNVERPGLVCGGFPCQPISVAGKRLRQEDDQWLWPEFKRCVRSLRPRYAFVENVPGLLSGGMGDVLGDLASLGYDAEWQSIQAAAIGAPHIRERVWIVANSRSERLEGELQTWAEGKATGRDGRESPGLGGVPVLRELPMCDPLAFTRMGVRLSCTRRGKQRSIEYGPLFGSDSWPPFAGPIRVVDGVPYRVDRLRALGNAVVPQVAEWIGRRIVECHE